MSKNEKEPLFSAKNMKFLTGPFSANNPVIVQILGICSALAVTVQLKPAIVMALPQTASITRYARSSMLDVIHEDFIRTARAKGIAQRMDENHALFA